MEAGVRPGLYGGYLMKVSFFILFIGKISPDITVLPD